MEKNLRRAMLSCAGCTLMLFVTCGLAFNVFSAAQPYVLAQNGFTNTQTSLITTIRSAAYLLGTFAIGRYYRRLGYRTGCALAAMLACVSFLLFAAAKSLAAYYFAGAVAGVSYALGSMVPASILMRRWFRAHSGLAIGICSAGTGLATVVFSPLFTAIAEAGGVDPAVLWAAAAGEAVLAVNVAVFAVKALYGRFDHQKHLIDQMHPPIQHHAAAPCPFLAPRAGNAVAAHDAGFDEIRLARQLVIYDVFDGEIIVVPAAVLMNLENHARFFRRVVHFLRFFDAHADRLFANNVFARFGGRLHVRRVHVVGRCDQHRVHRFVRPDLFGAFIGLVPRFFPGCGAFRVDIVNPDNLDGGLGSAFGIALQTPCMISAHAAVTDNDNLHNENLRTYIDIFVL